MTVARNRIGNLDERACVDVGSREKDVGEPPRDRSRHALQRVHQRSISHAVRNDVNPIRTGLRREIFQESPKVLDRPLISCQIGRVYPIGVKRSADGQLYRMGAPLNSKSYTIWAVRYIASSNATLNP